MAVEITHVLCHWQYDKTDKYHKWHLVESYGTDGDGHVVKGPQSPSTGNDKDGWMDWMYKPFRDEDDYDREHIMGRAVTIWSMESGVRLMELTPPEWADWLSVGFYELLAKEPHWYSFLEDGHDLYLGTAREVEKIINAGGTAKRAICL